jgi:hypothetical protein
MTRIELSEADESLMWRVGEWFEKHGQVTWLASAPGGGWEVLYSFGRCPGQARGVPSGFGWTVRQAAENAVGHYLRSGAAELAPPAELAG